MPFLSSFSESSGRPWQSLRRLKGALHPLRDRLEHDPYYRLQSYEEVALVAEWGYCLDVNRATPDDWLRLPGISIHQARCLSGLTQSGVQFYCLEDIAAALSVTPDSLEPLSPVLSFRYYTASGPDTSTAMAVNQASVTELSRLPGMTSILAQAIAAERQRRTFRNAADFQTRLRLPPDLMEQLIYYLRF